MLAQFEHVVARLVEDDRRTVSSISTLPSHEAVEILERWNPADGEREPARDVVLRIADAAEQAPSTVALVGGDTQVTYGQLVDRAAQVGDRLVAMGIGPGDRVGVLMPRVPGAIVAILGVLGAGAAYVPVDPDQPRLRVEEILDDAGARATIHDGTGDWESAAPVLRLTHDGRSTPGDTSRDQVEHLGATPGSADDVAYVLYTSGSTGEPKGVEVTRRNLAESTAARDSVYPSSPRAFLMMSPLIFDSSVAGIYWALTTGGTLVLPSPGMEQSVAHLGELISDHAVTHLLTLPSVYELLIESVDGASLSSLELAIVAGEPCPPSLVDRHHSLLPSVSMVNEYGPTEATVWATAAFLSAGDTTGPRVPIGKPTPHLRCFVLDKRLRPVPYGVTGELFVAGPSVARGYLGRPEETGRRFSPIRLPEIGEVRAYRTGDRVRYSAPGVLDLVGRLDDQLKVRGRRFELGEIESVAARHPRVKRAAARAFQRGKGGTEISLALVAADEIDLDVDELRAFLERRLPDYLVPGHIVVLDELPLTPNGKIDRDRLPLPDSPRRGKHLEPKTSEEEFVLRSTRDLLGHDRVELTDNFFEAGGHSLLSMHLIARIQRETGARISPNLLLFNSLRFVAASINPEQANLVDDGPPSNAVAPARRDEPIRFGRDAGLFGILHPAVAEPRADPVLICPPIGWEYYKSHWALRNLARNLSEAGHDAFRFDYAGTGDSLGEASAFSVEDWTKDIADARATLRSGAGSDSQILVGLRFGGALATVSALRDSSVQQLILWDPVVSGADHLASLVEMHTRFFERQDPRSAMRQSGDELLGSPYPKRLREAMGRVDLRLLDWDVDFDVVLVASADRPEYQELVEASHGRIELEVVDDASGWDDLVTFNSALLPTAIPRRITRLAGGER
jgi:amino acid adenylation domain-containing protein